MLSSHAQLVSDAFPPEPVNDLSVNGDGSAAFGAYSAQNAASRSMPEAATLSSKEALRKLKAHITAAVGVSRQHCQKVIGQMFWLCEGME
jgi:hypothetical protein